MILVTGATGYVGRHLMRRLCHPGGALRCLVRPHSDRKHLEDCGIQICTGDLRDRASVHPAFDGVRTVFHLAHIRFAPVVLACAPPDVDRIVLISSMQALSGVPSSSVDEVRKGEDAVRASGLPWIMLRPSMVYGPGDDRNISRLQGYLHRHRILPVPGNGKALQQPVFVHDLIDAVLASAVRGRLRQTYTVAGPRALTYDELVMTVGRAIGRAPVLLHIPVPVFLLCMRVAVMLRLRLPMDSEQVRRLQEDKSGCIRWAREDLGFQPLELAVGLARSHQQEEPAP